MFDTVVVGVDGRSGGRDALALANALIAPGGRLILAGVVCPRGARPLAVLSLESDTTLAERSLREARAHTGVDAATEVVIGSSPGRGMHMIADEQQADLLVVGSSQRGAAGRILLGNDTRAALNGAPCTVAVAPRDWVTPTHAWHTIGVGYDGSSESQLALAAARQLADRTGARIRVRAAVGPNDLSHAELCQMDVSDALERQVLVETDRLAALADVDADVVRGDAGDALCELADEADLLVIGSRGQGPWGRFVNGSTGDYLISHCPCPLLIAPRAARLTGHESDETSPGPRGPAAAAL